LLITILGSFIFATHYNNSNMIQRIQTVFLFLAIIALGAFNFFPYWQTVGATEENNLLLMSYGFTSADEVNSIPELSLYALVAVISLIAIIIVLVEIFQFKNRILQMKLAIANSFLMSVNLALMTYFVVTLQKDYQGTLGIGIFIYAMAMLLNILARRFIQKDEKLVRSVDRLR
jgi:uncharacterized protein DUF4293